MAYHVSVHAIGQFKNGVWHCAHGDKAAQNLAGDQSHAPGMTYWSCDRNIHGDNRCRFWLWNDHLEEAIKYHKIPEEEVAKARLTPMKRKVDGDIRDYYRSSKSPRTPRAPGIPRSPETPTPVNGTEAEAETATANLAAVLFSESKQGESSNRGRSNGGPSNTHRDLSPSPLPKTAAKDLPDLLLVSSRPRPQRAPSPSLPPSPPPPPPPSKFQPRTPVSNGKERDTGPEIVPPVPFPLAPSPGRRKLSSPELKAYNTAIKALAGDNIKLSLKGQNALRDIIKEETFWIK